MIDIQITIHVSPDPAQIDGQLQALARWIDTLSGQIGVNGAESAQTARSGTDVPETPQTPQTTPTTPAKTKRKRGRPRKILQAVIDHTAYWAQFDALVNSEMERLSVDERMPDTRRWNNERDPRLPTMANIFTAYEVDNLLALAAKLGLRPPLSALGVEAFQSEVAT